MNSPDPGEAELHAYLDGELDPERSRWVEAWLEANPERAAELDGWRQDARRLRAHYANPEQWPANPALDPAAIRRRQRAGRQRLLATAAALVLMLGIGVTGGWQAREMMAAPASPPMADAVQAYRLFTETSPVDTGAALVSSDDGRAEPVVDPARRIDQLFRTHFSNGVMPPDLRAAGLEMTDARLLATEQGPAAMVVYRDRDGRQMMMYIRPPGAGNRLLDPGKRIDGNLLAQYWSHGDYNYAVVSDPDDPNAAMLEQMLRKS